MEPALIGVKSSDITVQATLARCTNRPGAELERIVASVYIRLMRFDPDRGNRFFRFLRRMQAGGRSNMYGAVPYLMTAFGLDRNAAFQVVCEWMDRQPELESKPLPGGQADRNRRTI